VLILKFFVICLSSYVLCNGTFTTGILLRVKNVQGSVMAELDGLSWPLHGVTVEEAEKLEDSQHLAEFQRRNFGSRSHKFSPFVSCHVTSLHCTCACYHAAF
jgi:hypothetical protein